MLRFMPQRLATALCLCGVLFAAAPERTGVWLDVPFIPQQKDGCGSAVIAMVISYWQLQQPGDQRTPVDPGEIQRSLLSRPAHGIYASDLQKYIEEHGFQTYAFQGDWGLVRTHLEKGRPLIAALKPVKGASTLHYVVIAGLDWQNHLLLVNDPAQRKLLKVERKQFENEWAATHRWTLLALPR
jgi:ABC-type bacteriocin/lantibiotic exporter with double-glycine peptidase domain